MQFIEEFRMLDFIRCISILQFFYECMELGKSATLHSAYSVHFFLIQAVSAKFNTARRTKKIGEKANGAGTHLSASLRNPGPVAGFLLHSRCVKTSNSSRAQRSHNPHLPLTSSSRRRLAAVQCPPPPASPSPSPTPSGMRSSPRAAHPTSTYPCK